MNSFIAWIGGKRLLRKAIIERFPEEGFDRSEEHTSELQSQL